MKNTKSKTRNAKRAVRYFPLFSYFVFGISYFAAAAERQTETASRPASIDTPNALQVKHLLANGLDAYHQKEYDKALEWLDTLLEVNPRHRKALRYRTLTRQALAEVLYEDGRKAWTAGELDLADRYFLQALSLDPDHTKALGASQEISAGIVAQRKRESDKLYRKGLDAFAGGRQEQAADFWRRALELDSDNREARRGLERLHKIAP